MCFNKLPVQIVIFNMPSKHTEEHSNIKHWISHSLHQRHIINANNKKVTQKKKEEETCNLTGIDVRRSLSVDFGSLENFCISDPSALEQHLQPSTHQYH